MLRLDKTYPLREAATAFLLEPWGVSAEYGTKRRDLQRTRRKGCTCSYRR